MNTLAAMLVSRRHFAISVCVTAFAGMPMKGASAAAPLADAPTLSAKFAQTVAPCVVPSSDAVADSARRLDVALVAAGVKGGQRRFVVLVDRNPGVQRLLLFLGSQGDWQLVGAAPVSTGLPGRSDHFETPVGVFDHTVSNPDFRAEGTRNALGIRGYGRKGARVYDFGWVVASKGWGDHEPRAMRLQMHATDPDRLERRLGTAQSKGCIRIPASLNAFLDRFAVLDEEYEEKMAQGRRFWVMRADRTPTPWSGRYLVVIDSRQSGPANPVVLTEP